VALILPAAEPGPRRFRLDWRLLGATLVLVILFVSLGNWQLRRAEHKRELLSQRAARAERPPLASLPEPGEDATGGQLAGSRVLLQGRYQEGFHLLLQNQIAGGRAGMHVFSIFLPAGGSRALLVNRGWIAGAPGELPGRRLATETRQVAGVLREPPRPGFDFGAGEPRRLPGGGTVLPTPSLDMAQVQARAARPLYPLVVRLAPEAPGGFARDWPPMPGGAQRHVAYAWQWFAFAGLALVFYLLLSFRRAGA